MRSSNPDHYAILAVSPTADFTTLKLAYYRRAKECHPDHHPGEPEKEAEFKRLVAAFDVLSDPVRRREFDRIRRTVYAPDAADTPTFYTDEGGGAPVMDSVADDTLEELIVGNTFPSQTNLQTLMLDLEKTERFCLYREARTCLFGGRTDRAAALFERAALNAPGNILIRFYAAVALNRLGRVRQAVEHLEIALHLGAARCPPQRLERVRQELRRLRRGHGALFGRWQDLALPNPEGTAEAPDERMRRQLVRALIHLQRERRLDHRLSE